MLGMKRTPNHIIRGWLNIIIPLIGVAKWTSTAMFLYPFCLDTSKYQPTGSLNFSRIDNASLHSSTGITSNIYAVNYNILRVMNGMGALLYAN